jgi:hypothetical protein
MILSAKLRTKDSYGLSSISRSVSPFEKASSADSGDTTPRPVIRFSYQPIKFTRPARRGALFNLPIFRANFVNIAILDREPSVRENQLRLVCSETNLQYFAAHQDVQPGSPKAHRANRPGSGARRLPMLTRRPSGNDSSAGLHRR